MRAPVRRTYSVIYFSNAYPREHLPILWASHSKDPFDLRGV